MRLVATETQFQEQAFECNNVKEVVIANYDNWTHGMLLNRRHLELVAGIIRTQDRAFGAKAEQLLLKC